MKKKKEIASEYPKSIETFRPLEGYTLNQFIDNEPSSLNGWVRVEKYRITVEKVEEPIEVIHERIQKLWDDCDNWHHWEPIKNAAKKFGYKLKGESGNKKT